MSPFFHHPVPNLSQRRAQGVRRILKMTSIVILIMHSLLKISVISYLYLLQEVSAMAFSANEQESLILV
jgi:hypothetical protein